MTQLHVFEESLKASHKAEDLPFWLGFYLEMFGVDSFVSLRSCKYDLEKQARGIDRILTTVDVEISFDEKIRGRNQTTGLVYDDILLEYWSDEDRAIPGWVAKSLECDHIAYAIAPLGVVYLIPFWALRETWFRHSRDWISRYPRVVAYNRNPSGREWHSVSVPVPVPELARCLPVYIGVYRFEGFEWDH